MSWRRIEPDSLLVTIGKYRKIMRGKRKGRNTWVDTKGKALSDHKETMLPLSDVEQERRRWEAETGKCSKCGGDGQQWIGWSIDTDHRYDTCRRCNGNGKTVNINGHKGP